MPDVNDTALVAVTELGHLQDALPQLLGASCPDLDALTGAVSDVRTALFTAVVSGHVEQTLAVCRQQVLALDSVTNLVVDLGHGNVDVTCDALHLVRGLLDMIAPAL